MSNRETFKSNLGFILVSAGCAIGIGNVWKFPYVAGENGGGIFVVFYLLFLLIMGVPVLTMELSVGRASRKGPVGAFRALEKPRGVWHLHGWACIVGCYILMMYYTTVAGWMLGYFYKFATGAFTGAQGVEQTQAIFDDMLGNPWELILWMGIVVLLGFLVCSFSLQKGLERISKFMMLGLLGLILVLVVNSLTLDGAWEGVKFYLLPDFQKAKDVGLGNIITAAMNQSFFTLSVGIASMEIFGSYMPSHRRITGEAIRICSLDTFVALMAGMIIFPACFSFGIRPDAGPALIFVTLPNVFVGMPLGRLWGALFFVFMSFASFTTVMAVFQNLMAACEENFGWTKKKNAVINGIVVFFGSLPCVLSFNLLGKLPGKLGEILGGGKILDYQDFAVSNVLLPIGSLIFLLFCVTRFGWGFDNYLEECNRGEGIRMSRKLRHYFRYVLPVLILVILYSGIFQ